MQKKYQSAWVLMDRDTQADDNAEHLYRYLRKEQKDVNTYFLLARSSHDWKRLKREGFRLVAFGSLRHRLLMLNCEHFIASHIDRCIVEAVSPKHFGNQLKHRFTFLQHGVILHDLSDWLNTKEIDCFVASSPREYDSIANAGNRYKFSSREVSLTGIPRHDRLTGHAPPEKILLVMPTWRLSLAGTPKAGSTNREINTDFAASTYFREWNGLLGNDGLASLARRYGYRILFYPHLNVQPYGRLFELADNAALITHAHGSIQDAFKSASVMITDYSSVAFEFAIMQRPVVYFQFDRDEIFHGAHFQKGYFDYEADGFGPVCERRDAVLDAVEALLQRDAQMAPEHRARAESFLPLRDGRNCERTFQAIAALDMPAVARPITREEALEALDQAFDAGKWSSVLERAARIAEMDAACHEDRILAALRCAQAWRSLGDGDAAQQALDAMNIDARVHLATAIEYAEIASMQAHWMTAAARWEAIVPQLAAEEDTARAHAMRRLLTALYNANRFADAINVALALLANPDIGDALPEYAALGPIACELGEFEGARSLALCVLSSEQAQHEFFHAGPAYATLAALLERAGDPLKASGMWMHALRASPADATYATAFDALADQREAWSAKQWSDASRRSAMFTDHIGVTHTCESSNELDVGLALAAMHRNMGEFDAASQVLDALRRGHASDAFVSLEAGELALDAGDWASAEGHFHAAQAAPEGARLARAARGLLIARTELRKAGQHALAKSVFASRPDDIRVAYAFASAASRDKRWEDACDGWSAVVELARFDDAAMRAHASLKMIEALRETGRLDEAQHLTAMLR
ncbi:MAG TPA: CDP-glycerol glycerophosphotransferase family protein, partial [Burkholderiales bacterium]|nr:CDP-glycerol glycerophosphotransferase family protein [Burkholderiales bacterium]